MAIQLEQQSIEYDKVVLEITIPAADLLQFVAQAYLVLASREGLIAPDDPNQDPKELLEQKLSRPLATEMTTEAVMSMASPFARSKAKDVLTVGSPVFMNHDTLAEGKDFFFTAAWAILPRAELPSYDPVEITVPKIEIPENFVNNQIASLLEHYADYRRNGKTGIVEAGDIVELSLRTTKDGRQMGGLTFDKRPYETASGTMPDGFDEQIIGMEVGQTKDFSFEAPARINAQGNTVMESFESTATINGLMERSVPEFTNEWVAVNIEGCSTTEEYRNRLTQSYFEEMEEERHDYCNYVAASELGKRFQGTIPDAAYEAMQADLRDAEQTEAHQQGVTVERLREMKGIDEQQNKIRTVLQARERLVQSIALDALARHLGFGISKEDIDAFFKASAPAGQGQNMRRQFEGSGQMYLAIDGARRLKASEYLVEHAIIHYEDATAELSS